MLVEIHDLEPSIVWKHFQTISAIPRASTKEELISQCTINFGNSLNLTTLVDNIGNVIIKKPATKGKENSKPVVLQGHLDMVHQKETGKYFNFLEQGIEMYVEGDWVRAKGTTLGADNGMGVAMAMAVLSSSEIEHPPIEVLFTVDEEVGMTGAKALTSNQLEGAFIINLDSEEYGEITIGCAGGVDVLVNGTYDEKSLGDNHQAFEIKIARLTGGHSGMDIHLGRANGIKLMAELIQDLSVELEVILCAIEGGHQTNVIPRSCTAIVAIEAGHQNKFVVEFEKLVNKTVDQYSKTDPYMHMEAVILESSHSSLSKADQVEILSNLSYIPNGVCSMTKGIEGLVQTSNNIAKVDISAGKYVIACHTRSSVDFERDEIVSQIKERFSNAKVRTVGTYPGWSPNTDSELLKLAANCYQDVMGIKPKIKSVHAGLECGILSHTFPETQMISIGPNILGAHSPEERVQISSTKEFWNYLTLLLREI